MNSHKSKVGTNNHRFENGMPDLEHEEFQTAFRSHALTPGSMLFAKPAYNSFLNFPDDEDEALYVADESHLEEDEDHVPTTDAEEVEDQDRESYKNADQENMYYFI